jgi:molybdate transport system ATP-binding protein
MLEKPRRNAIRPALRTDIAARVLRHDLSAAMTILHFEDGELRAPLVDHPVGAGVIVQIEASDVSIALSRPMDVSITNRLPGDIVEIAPLDPPYVRASPSTSAPRASSRL